MKRMYTFAFALMSMAALSVEADAVSIPYQSDMASDGAGWTVINAVAGTPGFQAGGKTDFSGSGCETGYMYVATKDPDGNHYDVDDWVVSPGITLKAGQKYMIKYAANPQYSPDPTSAYTYVLYNLVAATGNTADALSGGTVLFDYNQQTNPNWNKSYGGGRGFANPVIVFTPDADGVYYFGFHLYGSLFNDYTAAALKLSNFRIDDYLSSITPKQVQDFYAYRDTVAPNRVLSHKFAWRLDTLDYDDNRLPPEITYRNVKFYRNEETEPFATIQNPLPGKDLNFFVDDASTGLTAGKHKLRAVCELSNGKVSAEQSYTMNQWAGPVPEQTVPWTMALSSVTFDNTDWLSVRGSTTTGGSWAKQGTSYIKYTPSSNKPDDCFLILPPMKIEKAGYYMLESNIKRGHSSQDGLEFFAVKGTPTTEAGFGEPTSDITFINDSYQHQYYNAFYVAEPGTYTIALRRKSPKATSTSTINIYGLAVKATELSPVAVTDLKGEVVNEEAKLTWTNPAKDIVGKDLTALSKIEIIRFNNIGDTTVVATLTENIAPGAAMTYNDKVVDKPFIYNYRVVPYLGENTHAQVPMNAFADFTWVGTKVQQLPYTLDQTGSVDHQAVIIPAQQLFKFEHESDAYNADFSLLTSYTRLFVGKNRTYNSRIVLPPMNLKPGMYKVQIAYSGGWDQIPVNVGYRMEGAEATGANIKNKVNFTTAAYSTAVKYATPVTIQVDDNGVANFIISVEGSSPTSGTMGSYFDIKYMHFERIDIVPSAATALKVTPDADGARKALVEWTNPTASNVAGQLPAITKVIVYRNGTEIATLTEGLEYGKKMTYNDNEVPDAGFFTYRVEVYSADGCAANPAEVRSAWIGKGKDLPYDSQNDYSEWTSADPQWTLEDGYFKYFNTDEMDTDDWIFSPLFNLEAGKYYVIDFSSWYGAGMDPVMEDDDFTLHFGLGANKAAMSYRLANVVIDTEREADAKAHQVLVKAVEPSALTKAASLDPADYISVPAGTGAFGFKALRGGYANIKNFAVSENNTIVGIEDVKADGFMITGDAVSFASAADVTIIDLNGRTVMAARGVSSVSLNGLAKGIYILRATVEGKTIAAKIVK